MKIKDRFIENNIIGYCATLLAFIMVAIILTINSIEAYYLKDIGFGFLVIGAIIFYILIVISIIIGIREIVVIRNNQIINHINSNVEWLLEEIEFRDKINSEIIHKELKACKKMKN